MTDRIQHAPHNAMDDPDDVALFYDRCSDLMRELLDALAAAPDRPRPFPEIDPIVEARGKLTVFVPPAVAADAKLYARVKRIAVQEAPAGTEVTFASSAWMPLRTVVAGGI